MEPKREWPDGEERVADGALIVYGRRHHGPCMMHTSLLPREVNQLMKDSEPDDMLELPHHADPEIKIYVRNKDINAVDVRFAKVDDE